MKDSMQVQKQIDRLLAYRAAEWMHTLRSGEEAEQLAFDQWLRQSPVHVEQFLQTIALDHELGSVLAESREDVEALIRRIVPNVAVFERKLSLWARVKHQAPRDGRWWVGSALAAAALLGLIVYLAGDRAGFAFLGSSPKVNTAVGEQRSMTLADGSLVTLNTLSEIRVDFSDHKRKIDLESGEAVFKVAQEASRPFEVSTKLATVRAIGTQFNVYQRPRDTLVSVLEGRVRVAAHTGTDAQLLGAGEEAQVLEDGRIVKRARPDVQKTLAWRQRRLSFEEAPLEDMVREFNRYNRTVHLRVEGVDAKTHRYGGIFDADDPDSLAQLLKGESDLIVEKYNGEILIRGR